MAREDYLRAFVLRSNYRRIILSELLKGEHTQAQLFKSTKLYRTHVRRTLLELIGKGLVTCLNPKDRLYKMYVLSERGRKLIKLFNEQKSSR